MYFSVLLLLQFTVLKLFIACVQTNLLGVRYFIMTNLFQKLLPFPLLALTQIRAFSGVETKRSLRAVS